MRLITVLSIILLVLIGFGYWINDSLAQNAKELTADFKYIEQLIKQENWDAAANKITEIEKSWSENKNWWSIVIDHQEIDNIEFNFAKIKSFIEARNTGLSLGELSVLEKTIEHIPEKEAVNIRNIL